tara:strand:- start:576 stop:1901 length:1326 start_codon:yes stop_codon:yes gene_type:complete
VLNRLIPRRLSSQLILAAVLALIAAQALTFPLFVKARLGSIAGAIQESTIARTASLARLLMTAPPNLTDAILESVNSRALKARLSTIENPPPADLPESAALRQSLLDAAPSAIASATVYAADAPSPDQPVIVIQAQLQNGMWLHTQLQLPNPTPTWAASAVITAAVLSLLLAAVMALILRRITRPLARLSRAAEALGRGQQPEALPEEGPADIVETVRAFNQMQVRISEHIEERTRTLASVSHDLRTPITALRLQLEFIEDAEQREQMQTTVQEMEAVTESALSYLKNTRSSEELRKVDVAALVDNACEELRQIGFDVAFEYTSRQTASCRPVLLKRALSNLVRNAAQYGERARVCVTGSDRHIEILIDDDGPGIPGEQLSEVVKPFVRLDQSRNRDTGGSGLGLAIANEIVTKHGGTLELVNAPEGGLRQRVRIPVEQSL